MGLTPPFWDGNRKKQINCVPAMREGNGNTKKLSRYSGREQILLKSFPAIQDGNGNPKSLPAVLEREFKAFLLGNIREREFPLMPARDIGSNIALCLSEFPWAPPLGTPSGKGLYLSIFNFLPYMTRSLHMTKNFHKKIEEKNI